ncbi:hypothetical protein B296_00009608 [Ensete ventricosum]|uniref:Uncharacterized protein n=1 Tax=Ensete ventricosum TaxID=4639 RepID=A0A427BAE8_ENSVE|nr:hypothetical protein B296_00009608 [Ensete ventricosum]
MAVARNTTAADRRAAEGSKTTAEASSSSATSPRKRTKSPGVRVIGGRIYDSENGKTLSAEDDGFRGVVQASPWGQALPYQVLPQVPPQQVPLHSPTLTAFCFTSCSAPRVTTAGVFVASDTGRTRKRLLCWRIGVAPNAVASRDKEKDHDEQKDVQCSVTVDDEKDEVPAKKQKKRRLKKLRSLNERDGGNVIELCNGNAKLKNANARKKGAKKVSAISSKIGMQLNNDEHVPNNCGNNEGQDLQHVARLFKQLHDDMNSCINKDEIKVSDKGKKNNVHDKTLCKGQRFQKHGIRNSNSDEAEVLVDMRNKNVKAKLLPKKHKSRKPGAKDPFEHDNLSIVVPQGLPLIEVAGCDWAAEDVGAALQFLEFCNAFSEV